MKENKHPYHQISDDDVMDVAIHVKMISSRCDVDWAVCKEIMRIGYELGWEGALSTPGAAKFSRLTKEAT